MTLKDSITRPRPIRRLRRFEVSPQFILDMIKVGDGVVIDGEKITFAKDRIPDDAEVEYAMIAGRTDCITLVISSVEFEEVPEGCVITRIAPQYQTSEP